MPIYSYKCRECGEQYEWFHNTHHPTHRPLCPECGYPMGRDYSSVTYSLSPLRFETHLNHATGTVVKSQSHFRDELKRKSEEASEHLGIEHNFVPVDPSDKHALGVTDSEDYAMAKSKVDSGKMTLPTRTFS